MRSTKRLVLSIIMICFIFQFSACNKPVAPLENKKKPKSSMKVSALNGPTGMGMVKLMKDNEDSKSAVNYDFNLVGSPDELVGKVVNGEVDVAAVPINLAMVLYNSTGGKVQLAAVNTLGVLYVLENGNSIKGFEDLKGKKVNVSGKGSMPEYVFQYLLTKNNLDKDVEVDFKLQHADLAAAVASGDADISLLPQPHVSTAMMKNKNVGIAIDINKEWKKAFNNKGELYMGAIIVQKEFAENNKETLNTFLDEYKTSVDFVNKNLDEASDLIAKYKILPNKEIAKKAIPYSNIVYIDAKDVKDSVNDIYKVLFSFDPKSVGGKLGDDQFYYQR